MLKRAQALSSGRRVTAAQVLAAGGIAAAALSAIGGLIASSPRIMGLASAIMCIANIAALAIDARRR